MGKITLGKLGDWCSPTLSEPGLHGKIGAEVFHFLLHLTDLSAFLAHTPLVAQLLMWPPAPRRAHKGRCFLHTQLSGHMLDTTSTCVDPRPPPASADVTAEGALAEGVLQIAQDQRKAAFGTLDARASPRSSAMLWVVDGVISFIPEGLLCPTRWNQGQSFCWADQSGCLSSFHPWLWSPSRWRPRNMGSCCSYAACLRCACSPPTRTGNGSCSCVPGQVFRVGMQRKASLF